MEGEDRPFHFNFGSALPQEPSHLDSRGRPAEEGGMSAEEISPSNEVIDHVLRLLRRIRY